MRPKKSLHLCYPQNILLTYHLPVFSIPSSPTCSPTHVSTYLPDVGVCVHKIPQRFQKMDDSDPISKVVLSFFRCHV